MRDDPFKKTKTQKHVERAIRQMYAEPLPTHDPETLRPLPASTVRELSEARAACAALARAGLIEPCGERGGQPLWQITELGRLELLLDGTRFQA